eukprot:139119-Chlamydomonas_euryale.AAC.3
MVPPQARRLRHLASHSGQHPPASTAPASPQGQHLAPPLTCPDTTAHLPRHHCSAAPTPPLTCPNTTAHLSRHHRSPELLLRRLQAALAHHDAHAQQECKQQLVLFEQRATDVLIERVREVVVDVPQALREAVLVHGVDARHVADAEEEHRVVRPARRVALACRVNLALRRLGGDLLVLDLVRDGLRFRQDLHRCRVLQDVALAGRQHVQDLVLDLLEAALVGGRLDDERLALRLQVGPLLRDCHAQQLVA